MSQFKGTPGPLTVRVNPEWPHYIETFNTAGEVVFRDDMPCSSSRDKTVEDTINCVNFPSHSQKKFAELNRRAIADATIRASAPALLEALQSLVANLDEGDFISATRIEAARAAIRQATGEGE